MGRSSSKLGETPNNPLQEMQFQETQREKRKKRMAKEQKQIKKLQEKHLKKNKHKHKKNNSSDTYEEQHQKRNSSGDSSSPLGSFNYNNLKYELNTDEFNKQKESKIQQHLKGDLNAFLLNQIVLSQQFFKNYDR